MTDQEIAELGPAFASFLRRFRPCFLQDRTRGHFDTFCRGLLADLPRKSVEPIALEAGTAVRTLRLFLTTARWDQDLARDTFQRHVADGLKDLPTDRLGTVGVFDETSAKKQGERTPGVQRQYLGCLGKVDNGIVTVHVGIARGRFQALLDADLSLPKSWDQDRERCQAAGIPDEVRYRPKWRIAFDQLLRLDHNGVKFDWLTFDADYTSKVPLLRLLSLAGQRFAGEAPVNFAVRLVDGGPSRRVDEVLGLEEARAGQRIRIPRETGPDEYWRAAAVLVRVAGRDLRLVAAVNEATAELTYFVSNAVAEPLRLVLLAAFRRASVEHGFRLAKQEAGLMHFEGRRYVGLVRHLILALLVMGFVAIHTDRLRGEKSPADAGAGLPGAEPAVRGAAGSAAGNCGNTPRRLRDPLPPAPQRTGHSLAQAPAA
jgi:SRSO17 transposase